MAVISIQNEAELITEFLTECREILFADMDSNDRNATGKTRASLQLEDVSNTGGKLMGAAHLYYTFKGRGPGGMPPLFKIIEWCRARGIPGTRAYAIAKTIKENGTKLHRAGGSKALDVATSRERVDAFIATIRANYIIQAKSDFNNLIAA